MNALHLRMSSRLRFSYCPFRIFGFSQLHRGGGRLGGPRTKNCNMFLVFIGVPLFRETSILAAVLITSNVN